MNESEKLKKRVHIVNALGMIGGLKAKSLHLATKEKKLEFNTMETQLFFNDNW